ncbi:GAF domain-containing protein [Luteimonas sp. e5]
MLINPPPENALEQALAACADEPIRFSAAVQPHGYLLSCDADSGIVRHASANCEELFEVAAQELIGQPLDQLIHIDLAGLLASPDAARFRRLAQYVASLNIGPQARFCDLSLHLAQGLAHLEIEPQVHAGAQLSAAELAHDMIARIALDGDDDDGARLHATMAEQVRRLTGFDRVMIYRFLDDDSGEVIAESLADGVPSYLGLRYPASDIPPQARALYLVNRVRVIADTGYAPTPILPPRHHDGHALDLSLHGLRSVSPVHLEYMRNMGMAASMSISIVVDDRLWGLVACHHRRPRQLPPRHRTAADLLGMFYSLRVASMQHLATAARKSYARSMRNRMIRALDAARDPATVIAELLPDLREVIGADAALYLGPDGIHADGDAVEGATLDAALAWLATQSTPIAASDEARQWRGADADAAGGHAGVLGLQLSPQHRVLLLRREQVDEVRWAGEPLKDLIKTDDGMRLAPRRSFNTWRETMRGHSLRWSADDLDEAEASTIVLRRALAGHRPPTSD